MSPHGFWRRIARRTDAASSPLPRTIDGPGVRRLVAQGAQLVDVRTPDEWRDALLSTALHVRSTAWSAAPTGSTPPPRSSSCAAAAHGRPWPLAPCVRWGSTRRVSTGIDAWEHAGAAVERRT